MSFMLELESANVIAKMLFNKPFRTSHTHADTDKSSAVVQLKRKATCYINASQHKAPAAFVGLQTGKTSRGSRRYSQGAQIATEPFPFIDMCCMQMGCMFQENAAQKVPGVQRLHLLLSLSCSSSACAAGCVEAFADGLCKLMDESCRYEQAQMLKLPYL